MGGLAEAVVGGFFGNHNIMRVAFLQAGMCDLSEPGFFAEFPHCAHSTVPHPGAKPAGQLQHKSRNISFIGNSAFNAFRHQFTGVRDIALSIAVFAALLHGADGPHHGAEGSLRVVPIKLFVENAVAMVVSIVVVVRSMSPVP